MTKNELISKVTRAVREANAQFEVTGGSSRHWVRDCFLPALERHELSIVHLTPVAADAVGEYPQEQGVIYGPNGEESLAF